MCMAGAATLYRRWSRYVTGSLSVRHGRMLNAETETEVLFGLSVNFTHSSGSYSAAKELESDRVSAQWNSPGRSRLSTPYAFALARTRRTESRVSGRRRVLGQPGPGRGIVSSQRIRAAERTQSARGSDVAPAKLAHFRRRHLGPGAAGQGKLRHRRPARKVSRTSPSKWTPTVAEQVARARLGSVPQ